MMNVLWIDSSKSLPLCDVPWHGTSAIQSSGVVYFCCFSDAEAGNIREEPFEAIWNGEKMRRIRQSLADQRLPPECQKPSCPIYREDERNHVVERVRGKFRKNPDPHHELSQSLARSRIVIADDGRSATLQLEASGRIPFADLFIALRLPDGKVRFLPGLEEFAVPYEALGIEPGSKSISLDLGCLTEPGPYAICAALFAHESNPSLLSNCFWSCSREFCLGEPLR